MSLINKVLQDLDERHALAAPEGRPPPADVRPVVPARRDREWFWRIFAALLTVAVAWVIWVAYQLYPPSLVTDAAFRAAESARRSVPPAPAAAVPAAVPPTAVAPAAAPPAAASSAAESAAKPPAVQTFRLAQEMAKPAPEPVPAPQAKPVNTVERAPASKAPQANAPAAKTPAAAPAAAKPAGAPPPARIGLDVQPAQIIAGQGVPRVEKRDRVRTPAERAEAEFRRAVVLLSQARVGDAEEALGAALAADARHLPARQALVALLIERHQFDEARRLLQEGLAIDPAHAPFAVALARILIERREYAAVLEALARAPSGAEGEALRGNALQRLGRHREAAEAFEAAARAAPENGGAWLGLAISLEALGRGPEAAEAYRRAAATGTLRTDVRDYAAQRARELR
jgi:MSHA biogenesis protein MshN